MSQVCVLTLLFTLRTHWDDNRKHISIHVEFVDDTAVMGLISDNDQFTYREEGRQMVELCQDSSLSLNVEKTKEIAVDFRINTATPTLLHINGSAVKFLGVHMADDGTLACTSL